MMSTSKMFVIVYLVLVNSVWLTGGTEDIWSLLEPYSTAVTGNTYIYIGGKLELTCNLNRSLEFINFDPADISFQFKQLGFRKKTKSPVKQCLYGSHIHVKDATSAELEINPVTVNNAGEYSCFAGPQPCYDNFVGVGNDIHVEYAPHNVSSFQCYVLDWVEGIVCQWLHPVDYVKWDDVTVELFFVYPNNRRYPCPHLDRTSCVWTDGYTALPRYYPEVIVTNKRTNDTAQKTFTVYANSSVKPSAVKHLQIVSTSKGCLQFSWTHLAILYDKVYRVLHKGDTDNNYTVLATNLTSPQLKRCGFKPMTWHTFAVDVYPSSPYSGYWSDQKTSHVQIAPADPDKGPDITNGSYISHGCERHHRNVTIMWSDVDKEARNGYITDVSIWVDEVRKWKGPSSVYSATITVSCESFRLHLYAHNVAGRSLQPSTMVIPLDKYTETSRHVFDTFSVEITQHGNTADTLQASWYATTDTQVTIFWCERKWPNKNCTGKINWIDVPRGHNSSHIPIGSKDPNTYLYGISVQDKTTLDCSQIHWAGCLFCYTHELPAPSNFELEPTTEAILARWSPMMCFYKCRPKVKGYILKWRESHQGEEEAQQIQVNKQASSHHITDLKAETKYFVMVQSLSTHQQLGEHTSWVTAVPLVKESASISIWIIIVLVGVAVLVLVAVACYCTRRCIMLRNEMKNDVQKVQDLFGPVENTKMEPPSPPPVTMGKKNSKSPIVRKSSSYLSDKDCSSPVDATSCTKLVHISTGQHFISVMKAKWKSKTAPHLYTNRRVEEKHVSGGENFVHVSKTVPGCVDTSSGDDGVGDLNNSATSNSASASQASDSNANNNNTTTSCGTEHTNDKEGMTPHSNSDSKLNDVMPYMQCSSLQTLTNARMGLTEQASDSLQSLGEETYQSDSVSSYLKQNLGASDSSLDHYGEQKQTNKICHPPQVEVIAMRVEISNPIFINSKNGKPEHTPNQHPTHTSSLFMPEHSMSKCIAGPLKTSPLEQIGGTTNHSSSEYVTHATITPIIENCTKRIDSAAASVQQQQQQTSVPTPETVDLPSAGSSYYSTDLPTLVNLTPQDCVPLSSNSVAHANVPTPQDCVPTSSNYVAHTNVPTLSNYVAHTNVPTSSNYVAHSNVPTSSNYVAHANVPTSSNYVAYANVPTSSNYAAHLNVPIPQDCVSFSSNYAAHSNVPTSADCLEHTNFPTPLNYIAHGNVQTSSGYIAH